MMFSSSGILNVFSTWVYWDATPTISKGASVSWLSLSKQTTENHPGSLYIQKLHSQQAQLIVSVTCFNSIFFRKSN